MPGASALGKRTPRGIQNDTQTAALVTGNGPTQAALSSHYIAAANFLHAALPDVNASGHPASLIALVATTLQFVAPGDTVEAAIAKLDAAIQQRLTLHAALSDLTTSGHPASVISTSDTFAHSTGTQVEQVLKDFDAAITAAGTGSSTDVISYLTADSSPVVSSVSFVDSGLTGNVLASGVYALTASIIYTTGTTGDVKVKWVAPTGAALDWQADGLTTGTTGATGSVDRTYRSLTGTPGYGGAAADASTATAFSAHGLLRVSTTAGTFKMQFAQNTSDTVATTIKAGSYMILKKLA